MNDDATTPRHSRAGRWVRGGLASAVVAQVLLYALILGPGVPPDEIAHASYAAHLADTAGPLPDLTRMRLLESDGRWGPQPAYLAHPPLPYLVLEPFVPSSPAEAGRSALIRRLRWPAAAIGMMGIGALLWAVWRERLPWPLELMASLTIAAPPMVAVLAASVTNDTSTWIAAGLTLVGLSRLREEGHGWTGAALAGAGVALALLSKLTAALICGLTAGLALAGWLWVHRSRLPRAAAVVGIIAALAAPGIAYHLMQLGRHGTLVPRATVLQAGAVEAVEAAGEPARLSVPGWTGRFVHLLGVTWVNITAHRFIDRDNALEVIGLLLLPVLAAAGLAVPRSRGPDELGDVLPILRAAALAGAVVAVIHFVFTYRLHLQTGYLGGVQARYYFPLLPVLGLLAARGLAALCPHRWVTPAALVVSGLLVLANVTAMVRVLADPLWRVGM